MNNSSQLKKFNLYLEDNLDISKEKKGSKNYDFISDYFASFTTIFNILKSIDGFGLLITPYLFSKTNIYLGFLSFIITIGIFIFSSKIFAIISLKTKFNGENYQYFVSFIMGYRFGFFFFLLNLILDFFYSFCYMIFSYYFFNIFFCSIENQLCNSSKLITVYFLFICFLLIFRKKIKKLLYFVSIISSISLVLFIFTILFKNFDFWKDKIKFRFKAQNNTRLKNNFINFFLLIGANFFSFKNIGVLISNQRTNNISNIGLKTYSITWLILGLFFFIFAYITSTIFKYELKEIVIFNISYYKDKFLFILEIIYGIGIILKIFIDDLQFFITLKKSHYIKYLFIKFKLNDKQINFFKIVFKYFIFLIYFLIMIFINKRFIRLIILIGSVYGLIFIIIIPFLLYIFVSDFKNNSVKLNITVYLSIILLTISLFFSIKNF